MGSRSLQIDKTAWSLQTFGECALLLEPEAGVVELSEIHKISSMIERSNLEGLTDVIPTYKSLALLFDKPVLELELISTAVEKILDEGENYEPDHKEIRVPLCYDLGLDWQEIQAHTGLEKEKIIELHSGQNYTVAMMGFVPGFMYLQGLHEKLSCPRKKEPRTKVPPGAVGIGGTQTGIYSLESPGGWQVLGRTPMSFFDRHSDPPIVMELGDVVIFDPISLEEFESMAEVLNP